MTALTFKDIILLLVAVIAAVGLGFLISTLLEIKRVVSQATSFLKTTEESLKNTETAFQTTLAEMDAAFKGVRDFTENANALARDARTFSASLADTGNNLRLLSHELEGSMSKVTALRVGLRTGFDVFVKHLLSRKGGGS